MNYLGWLGLSVILGVLAFFQFVSGDLALGFIAASFSAVCNFMFIKALKVKFMFTEAPEERL